MEYDGTINLALGTSAKTKLWKNQKWQWSALVKRLTDGHKTNETFAEFLKAPKVEQDKIKDVGGYVGGYLRAGRRSPANVVNRQLLTLDIDFAHNHFWDSFTLFFDNAAVLHGTHKHTEEKPRYRLVMPLSREVSPDEYVAIARRVAGTLGISFFDNTTFQVNRLMFWPSSPKDVDYYSRFQDGEWLDADKVLGSYIDWRDSSLWPTAEKQFDEVKAAASKQEDPETKKGVIGAFCRSYPIEEAIEKFLPDVYTPTQDGRYTYLKGSTASGLITYNGKFAYSHHGTDPCGGKLCNSFDLVRIHMFGHLDPEGQPTGGRSKSFKAMEELAKKDGPVKMTIANETIENVKYDFADDFEPEEGEDNEWVKGLEVNSRGEYLSTSTNLNLIFANDPRLKGAFRQNDFDGKRYIFKSVPWRKVGKPEPVKNVDYSGVRNYIETVYGIAGMTKVDDSLALEFERHMFHPIRDYLNSLEWDGVQRIDKLLVDYLGAANNIYTWESMRKMLVGAVARVMRPGCKFDLVLTLVGAQGTYKSMFVNKLGRQWFSDTFLTVQGKEALEQIQGAWLIEMAELSGLRKAEVESVKHFISKQEDTFRPAYGRVSETYRRQCVFFGTTNNAAFLRDPSGNRRFLPIDTDITKATKSVPRDLDGEVDQIWAEAMVLYKAKEKLYLSKDAELMALEEQRNHSEIDERTGIIMDYLDKKLPVDWEEKDLYDRRDYLASPEKLKEGKRTRVFACVAEVWCECLGKEREDISSYNTRGINDILRSLPDWEPARSTMNFPLYGKQKYYVREIC